MTEKLIEAARALVKGSAAEQFHEHMRRYNALRDALAAHDEEQKIQDAAYWAKHPKTLKALQKAFANAPEGTLQHPDMGGDGPPVPAAPPAGEEASASPSLSCTCGPALDMGADLQLGCPVHDETAIENARRQRIVDARRRNDALPRRPTIDEAADFVRRRMASATADGNIEAASAYGLALDYLENARYDVPADEAQRSLDATKVSETQAKLTSEMACRLARWNAFAQIEALLLHEAEVCTAEGDHAISAGVRYAISCISRIENDERLKEGEQRRPDAQEQCCYESPAGIHSENCPTRADEARCRRCSECRGENHHWLEECEEPTPEKPDGWAGYICKHCEARAAMCLTCDGAAEPGHVCDVEEDA